MTTTRACTLCEVEQPITEFHKQRGERRHPRCKTCRRSAGVEYRAANVERLKVLAKESRARRVEADPTYKARECLKRSLAKFGATMEDYEAMVEAQGGLCAICGRAPDPEHPKPTERVLQKDHCHREGGLRGLLCGPCNRGLGQFGDDLDRLRAAVAYLEGF